MPVYRCKIVDESGQKQTVIREAEDELTLRALLRRDALFLVKANVVKKKEKNTFFAVSSKVKPNEVIHFLRQFSVMVKAGIPINDSLNTLRSQNYSVVFQKVLDEIYFSVESGVLLSAAFAAHPKVFPVFFVSMVAIGEVSGSLDKVLSSMADYYENDRRVKRKAKSALVYPTMLFVLIIVVSLFINLFVLPKFEKTLTQFGGEMPALTVAIMSVSRFLQDYFFIILPAFALLVLLMWLFFRTARGRYFKDWLRFYLPILGSVERNVITARFSKAFIILLGSGMNMIDCLENLQKMLGNQVFFRRFGYSIQEVRRGMPIATSIAATKLFPEILTQMISVGEKSGNIEEVLESTGAYFDECVESSIAKATAALEPIMIILLGAVVGVVILAVLMPMISMMSSI